MVEELLPERAKPALVTALLRFGVVGAGGTLINVAIVEALHGQLGWGYTRSLVLATEVAIIGNYIGNELWTFHHRRLHWRRLVQFNSTMLVGALVQVGSATVLERVLDFDPVRVLGLPLYPYHVATVLGIGIGSALNFGFNFGWTWRH